MISQTLISSIVQEEILHLGLIHCCLRSMIVRFEHVGNLQEEKNAESFHRFLTHTISPGDGVSVSA